MTDGDTDGWDWKVPVDSKAESVFSDDLFVARVDAFAAALLGSWEPGHADRLRRLTGERWIMACTAANVDPYDPVVGRAVMLAMDLVLMTAFSGEDATQLEDSETIVSFAATLGLQSMRISG